jgi:hypothetical protein
LTVKKRQNDKKPRRPREACRGSRLLPLQQEDGSSTPLAYSSRNRGQAPWHQRCCSDRVSPRNPREGRNYAEDFCYSVACNCHVRWLCRREGAQAQSPAESLAGVLSDGPGGKSKMRLRSGKNDVREGNVVPRLRKYVHAIARTTTGASYQIGLRPPRAFSVGCS